MYQEHYVRDEYFDFISTPETKVVGFSLSPTPRKRDIDLTFHSTPDKLTGSRKTSSCRKIHVISAEKHKPFMVNEILDHNAQHQSYLRKFFNYFCPASVDYGCNMEAEKFWNNQYTSKVDHTIEFPLQLDSTRSPIEMVSFMAEEERCDVYMLNEFDYK